MKCKPTTIPNSSIAPKCLCHYENEIEKLKKENNRLKLALSEKLNELLPSKY